MNEYNNNSFRFESPDLIEFFIKHFKPLAIITIVGAIIAIVVALSIKPRYKSTVVLFPASSSSISSDLLSMNSGRKDILKFGEEEEVEQMLQVLNSDEIRNTMVNKYNLMEHYEIDSLEAYPLTKLYKEFADNISFRRTEFMSIEIEVLDTDPQLAADLANNIAAEVDTAMNRMKKGRALLILNLVKDEFETLKEEMRISFDSLRMLQMKGINNYETQAEVFNDAYAQALLKGETSRIKALEDKLDILSQYGAAYMSIRDKLIYDTERLSNLKAKLTEANVDYEQALPHKFIVDNAVKAEKKTKPVRWLIVVLSTMAAFIFSFLFLIIYDGLSKKLKTINSK